MSKQNLKEVLVVVFLLALILALVLIRSNLVDHSVGSYLACENCFDLIVLDSDLLLVYLVSTALLIAGMIRTRFAGRILHLGIGLVLLFYIADLFVFRFFNYRLFISDIALYFGEWRTVWDQFSTGIGNTGFALLTIAVTIGLILFLPLVPAIRGGPARILLSVVLIVAVVTDLAIQTEPFVNSWTTDNVIRVNMESAERVRYSREFTANLPATAAPDELRMSTGRPQSGRNVILVIVESWSSWHSKAFGGFHDWTPALDAAADKGLKFANFHSIGYATVNGLIGILGGQDIWSPFLPFLKRSPFHSMWGIEDTLPRVFRNMGYEVAFLTTGPLDLYRKGEWMEDIGFSYVEGGEHRFYAGEKLYAFRSPSDAALYRRSLEWIQASKQPYFLVLETVTTHQPYIDPDTGERSLEKAMKFADRSFGEFLDSLEQSGFFDNGLLLVVSDHRSMTPIPWGEMERFGPSALSRIPAFFLGPGIEPGSIDERIFSQGDLVPTFEAWLSGSIRLGPEDNDMLGHMQSPKCAFHERGDRRGVLLVICPEGNGQIFLDGDETRFVESTGLDEKRKRELLTTVAWERLAGLRRYQSTGSTTAQ